LASGFKKEERVIATSKSGAAPHRGQTTSPSKT